MYSCYVTRTSTPSASYNNMHYNYLPALQQYENKTFEIYLLVVLQKFSLQITHYMVLYFSYPQKNIQEAAKFTNSQKFRLYDNNILPVLTVLYDRI